MSFSESSSLSPLPHTHHIVAERVDEVLEDETNTIKSGETHKYLTRWKSEASTIDLQLDRGDLKWFDPM